VRVVFGVHGLASYAPCGSAPSAFTVPGGVVSAPGLFRKLPPLVSPIPWACRRGADLQAGCPSGGYVLASYLLAAIQSPMFAAEYDA
jgi:hypothetical protein